MRARSGFSRILAVESWRHKCARAPPRRGGRAAGWAKLAGPSLDCSLAVALGAHKVAHRCASPASRTIAHYPLLVPPRARPHRAPQLIRVLVAHREKLLIIVVIGGRMQIVLSLATL